MIDKFVNKIIHGDCLEIMKEIPDNSIDMVLCDLPYGITACSWDVIIPFEPLWTEYLRIGKKNCAYCLFGNEPFSSYLRISNIKMFRYDWIWIKNTITGFASAAKQPLRSYEIISIFYANQPVYNPQGLIKLDPATTPTRIRKPEKESIYGGKDADTTLSKPYKSEFYNYPKNVLYFACANETIHPTQKPVELIQYLVMTYSNLNDVVLDNCMGSGTTAIAAIKTDRKFVGIELNQEYVDSAHKRIDDELRQGDFFRDDSKYI